MFAELQLWEGGWSGVALGWVRIGWCQVAGTYENQVFMSTH